MIQGLDKREGEEAVFAALRSIEGLRAINDADMRAMIACAIAADISYMEKAGIHEGAEYDEYAAFDAITRALAKRYPARAAMLPSFADDYMEAWEVYLDSAGLIEWD